MSIVYEEEGEVYQEHLLIDHTQVAKRRSLRGGRDLKQEDNVVQKQQQEPVQAIQATESTAAVAPSQSTELSLKAKWRVLGVEPAATTKTSKGISKKTPKASRRGAPIKEKGVTRHSRLKQRE